MSFWTKREKRKNLFFFAYSDKKANRIKTGGWDSKGKKLKLLWIYQFWCPSGRQSVTLFCFVLFISKSSSQPKSVRKHASLHTWLCSHTTCPHSLHMETQVHSSHWIPQLWVHFFLFYTHATEICPTDGRGGGKGSHYLQAYFSTPLQPTQPVKQPKALAAILVYYMCSTTNICLAELLRDRRGIKENVPVGGGGGKERSSRKGCGGNKTKVLLSMN
jgi:hypothetical protein